MENPYRGRKVKIKTLIEELFKTHAPKLSKIAEEYNAFTPKSENEALTGIKKYNSEVIDILKKSNRLNTFLQLVTRQIIEEKNLKLIDSIDIKEYENRLENLGWDRLLSHVRFLDEMIAFSKGYKEKKKLPVEIKNSKATDILDYLCNIKIKERNHTTDITKNDNLRLRSKIIKNLNTFLTKRHLNEFLRYHIVKEENMTETESIVEVEYLNNFKIERENVENMAIFCKNFEENGVFNKKEPPDKETSLEEENGKLKRIEVIRKKPQNAKHKKAKNQCSIEEQRKKDRKRFKPPDTGWI